MARSAKTVVVKRPGWWASRTLREKRLLLAMLVVLTLVFIWFLIVRPLMDARANAEARLTAAVTELGRARADAAALKETATDAPGAARVPLPLDNALRQAGAEAGLTNLAVVGDGPGRATITMAQVRPPAFFGWIGQLEARGVTVEALSARANQDQTIAVEAVLRAGGR